MDEAFRMIVDLIHYAESNNDMETAEKLVELLPDFNKKLNQAKIDKNGMGFSINTAPYRIEIFQTAVDTINGIKKWKEESGNGSSQKKGNKIDYLRVIEAMYKYGFFVDQNENKALKKDVLNVFSIAVNEKFKHPDDNLSQKIMMAIVSKGLFLTN
ncbi:hypothetical protein Barb7_00375 [Bacteroidales bacterium Barb7]|nr:hypothetical protein Barb7_00375 [Bacteroidales bacterium Barb7]